MATTLASRDYVEKGVCPNLSRDREHISILKPTMMHNEVEQESDDAGSISPPLQNFHKTPLSRRQQGQSVIVKGAVKIEGLFQRTSRDVDGGLNTETLAWCVQEQAKIDPKSITQTLFNTRVMSWYHDLIGHYEPVAWVDWRKVIDQAEHQYRDNSHATKTRLATSPDRGGRCHNISQVASDRFVPPRSHVDIRLDEVFNREPPNLLVMSSYPQSHFDYGNILELRAMSQADGGELLGQHRLLRQMGRTGHPILLAGSSLGDPAYREKFKRYYIFLAYSSRSITDVLSSTDALLQSFLGFTGASPEVASTYEMTKLTLMFRLLGDLDFHPRNIFPSLYLSAGKLYLRRPARSDAPSNNGAQPTMDSGSPPETHVNSSDPDRLLSDLEACHIIKVILAALVASVPGFYEPGISLEAWGYLSNVRAAGRVVPDGPGYSLQGQKIVNEILSVTWALEDAMALSLARRLCRAIATRFCLREPTSTHMNKGKGKETEEISPNDRKIQAISRIMRYVTVDSIPAHITASNTSRPSLRNGILDDSDDWDTFSTEPYSKCWHVILEWLRTVILKNWNSKPWIPRCSEISGALELLSWMYAESANLGMLPRVFETPILAQRLDTMEMPPEWVNSDERSDAVHLLSFPFMFSQSTLISYFRAINYASMYKAFHKSAVARRMAREMTFTRNETGPGTLRMNDDLRIAQTGFLVLEVRRDNVLKDAMDQIWRRQHRELMRPLRVQMGAQEGEQGVDHGGVQQEFFRVVIAEVLNPDYGVFNTDPVSQMSWFKPGSLEPQYKYELLGLFASLAIYNGVTLPFNFPKVLYRKLLGLPSRLEDLADGWPQLTKGLEDLRDYEGDVEQIFMREYVFSMDVFGRTVDLDMWNGRDRATEGSPIQISTNIGNKNSNSGAQKATKAAGTEESVTGMDGISTDKPSIDPTTTTPPMVTNANRHEYISDYINHLIHISISSQYDHFTRGFFRCITRRSLHLFTPSQLKNLVEGCPNIDTAHLKRFTNYEGGYHPNHPTIKTFWGIVSQWPQEKVGRLLEFVTASDRLPIGGEARVQFMIQRNGEGNERLPTSLTCFGRLLLPEYKDKTRMEQALELAVENAKGFGTP